MSNVITIDLDRVLGHLGGATEFNVDFMLDMLEGDHPTGIFGKNLAEEVKRQTGRIEPVHVFDSEGDVWVERSDGLFAMPDSAVRPHTLDEIEEDYGIDATESRPAWVSGDIVVLGNGARTFTLTRTEDGWHHEDLGTDADRHGWTDRTISEVVDGGSMGYGHVVLRRGGEFVR